MCGHWSAQSFKDLPDANKVSFIDTTPVDLRNVLPNLPQPDEDTSYLFEPMHFPPAEPSRSALDLVHRFLVYPPERRLKASDAMHHPWLAAGSILLPPTHPSAATNITSYNDMGLGNLIQAYTRPRHDASRR